MYQMRAPLTAWDCCFQVVCGDAGAHGAYDSEQTRAVQLPRIEAQAQPVPVVLPTTVPAVPTQTVLPYQQSALAPAVPYGNIGAAHGMLVPPVQPSALPAYMQQQQQQQTGYAQPPAQPFVAAAPAGAAATAAAAIYNPITRDPRSGSRRSGFSAAAVQAPPVAVQTR